MKQTEKHNLKSYEHEILVREQTIIITDNIIAIWMYEQLGVKERKNVFPLITILVAFLFWQPNKQLKSEYMCNLHVSSSLDNRKNNRFFPKTP